MKTIPSAILIIALLTISALLLEPAPLRAEYDPPAASGLDCGTGDPAGDENPASTDLVGDLSGENSFWTAASWYDLADSGYVYFAMRLNGDPSGPKGFAQYAWTALMQVPSAPSYDPDQYQYAIVLNGIGPGGGADDVVQLEENSDPEDLSWDPILNDPTENTLWSHDFASGGPGADPLGDALAAYEAADSSIGGDGDFILYWAIPIQVLIDQGIISGFVDLATVQFLMASSANANNYNKDIIDDCPFKPPTPTSVDLISMNVSDLTSTWSMIGLFAATALFLFVTAFILQRRSMWKSELG